MLEPPPDLTVSEWSDRYRQLSRESSAEPGQWSTERAPYQRGLMDVVTDPSIREVWVMKGAQVGWSEILLNVSAYFMDQDPAPMLMIQPTIEMAQAFSKDRVAPMLRDTPKLEGLVKDPRSRDSGNTLLHKSFPGGHLTLAGANSPASLASRPVRVVLFDEVDRYPLSAGTEGDPVSLGMKRSVTFWNRKTFAGGTPTTRGLSRTEQGYLSGDRRKFYVPCPGCDHRQVLRWSGYTWEKERDEETGEERHLPETTRYQCEACDALWTDAQRWEACRLGEWRATAKGRDGVASFHVWEAYSPWVPMKDTVSAFLEAKRSPETLKAWVNTTLGEAWEDDSGEAAESSGLVARAEPYPASPLPDGVLVLTCGVDVQKDRLEVGVVGWGADFESWQVDYWRIPGDPAGPQPWSELDALLTQRWTTSTGHSLSITATCIDSGGLHTQTVYAYCNNRRTFRVYAIKGRAGQGVPIFPRKPTVARKNQGKQRAGGSVYIVGVDAAKELLLSRLQLETPGPGYCHVPQRYPADWFEQLTAEKRVTKYRHGRPYHVWVKTGANEAWDVFVYNLAAVSSLAVDINELAARRAQGLPLQRQRRGRRVRNKGPRHG